MLIVLVVTTPNEFFRASMLILKADGSISN